MVMNEREGRNADSWRVSVDREWLLRVIVAEDTRSLRSYVMANCSKRG